MEGMACNRKEKRGSKGRLQQTGRERDREREIERER